MVSGEQDTAIKEIPALAPLDTLAGIYDAVQNVNENDNLGKKQILSSLEKFVFTYRETQIETRAMEIERWREIISATRTLYRKTEVELEYETRDAIVRHIKESGIPQGKSSAIDQLLEFYPPIQRTFEYSAIEAERAMVRPHSHIAHVGMGSLPETLLGFHRGYEGSIQLTGIDKDAGATSKASELLQEMGLENDINLICANGAEADYQPYTHILLAVLVRPELETVKRICNTADKHNPVTVMLRTVQGLGNLVYQSIDPETEKMLDRYDFRLTDVVAGHAIMKTNIYIREV